MDKVKNNTALKFINLLNAVIFYIIYIIMYNTIDEYTYQGLEILRFILSWLGILIYIVSIYSWYKVNKRIFDLYTIMFTFLMVFNYGQCFLWAFDIHIEEEIGSKSLFQFGVPNNSDIVLTQLLTLINIYFFNLGALYCNKSKNKENNLQQKNELEKQKEIIYGICKLMSYIVIPITLIKLCNDLTTRMNYGYSALYYGENLNSNLLYELFSRLFYVCLFGLLIGSGFKKNVRKFAYSIFFIYIIISIICGDRGGWASALCIFAFLHHNYVKKFKLKTIVLIFLIGIICLNIINSIVTIRNTEFSLEAIKESIAIEKNPITEVVAEMGGSMKIQTILIMGGHDIYPYGNTYLFSILGIVSDKIIKLFGFDYINLSTWFSQYYLGLENWGAGFSIIGEALINFGPYLSPIIMLTWGWLIARLTYINNKEPLRNMFCLITCISLMPIFRGILSYNLKIYFYRMVIFYGLYLIFLTKYKKHIKNGENKNENNVLYI